MKVFQLDNVATGDNFALSALDIDGQAWFIASDVCKSLGLDPTAVRRLDDDERNTLRNTQPNRRGNPNVTIINEPGLYSLIFSSNKEAAKRFKKWITSVVIPSVRHHGGYITGQEALSITEQAQTLQVIHKEAQRVGLCALEEREARSEAFKLMRGNPSYGPGGNPRKNGKLPIKNSLRGAA